MSSDELTRSGVLESMIAEVPEPLYSEAYEFMTTSPLLGFFVTGDPQPTQ